MIDALSHRARLLFILNFLEKNTDEEHPVSSPELIKMLEKENIKVERKAIYKDIEALNEMGYDIVTSSGKNRGFFMASRRFQLPEVSLLIDAVQAAGFIPQKKTENLVGKLEELASCHEAKKLGGRVCIENRSKSKNESVYYIIEDLNRAINEKRAIEVVYKKNIVGKTGLEFKEKTMVINPYALLWDNDHYYLIGNNAKYDNLTHLRIDRIGKVKILDVPARHFSEVSEYSQRFDTADYARKTFNMFGGELCRIDLECDEKLLDQMLDQFGNDIFIRKADEGKFRFSADALISDGLIGWIMQFGGKVKVISPESLKNDVSKIAEELANIYKSR